jgi:hypothetical protein
MKSVATTVAFGLLLATATLAAAQTAPAPSAGHGHHGPPPAAAPGPGSVAAPAAHQHGGPGAHGSPAAGSAHGQHSGGDGGHMAMMGSGMMCPMMMMSQGVGNASDPRAQARVLRMRGDMMKAIGDVMLKHAQALEQEK